MIKRHLFSWMVVLFVGFFSSVGWASMKTGRLYVQINALSGSHWRIYGDDIFQVTGITSDGDGICWAQYTHANPDHNPQYISRCVSMGLSSSFGWNTPFNATSMDSQGQLRSCYLSVNEKCDAKGKMNCHISGTPTIESERDLPCYILYTGAINNGADATAIFTEFPGSPYRAPS